MAAASSLWTYSVLCIAFFAIRIVTYWSGTRERKKKGLLEPKTAPFVIPYWDHMKIFFSGGPLLANAILPYCGTKIPIRFRIPGCDLFLLSGPAAIRSVLGNIHDFNSLQTRVKFIGNALGVSGPALRVIAEDVSGSARDPVSGTSVHPHRRILWLQQKSTFNPLSTEGIGHLVPRYVEYLERTILEYDIGQEWTELPDAFPFLLRLAFNCSVNTLFGPTLLQMTPDFEQNFWSFDFNMHKLHMGLPRWWVPEAWNARDKCLEGVAKWRRGAKQRAARSKLNTQKEFWDDAWGCKVMRQRNEMYELMPEWDDKERDKADLGFLWATNDNLPPCLAWLVIELLRNKAALQRFVAEVAKARRPSESGETLPRFDLKVLMLSPYVQSVFHEVLRTQVTTITARDVMNDQQIGPYTIKKGSVALVSILSEHMDKSRWETRPMAKHHPVEEFWPERFLDYTADGEEVVSMKGLEGTFIPFGTGHAVCPGRHFASRTIILVAATLLTAFDFEPLGDQGWMQKQTNFAGFGYTAYRPSRKFPFKIRKKLGDSCT